MTVADTSTFELWVDRFHLRGVTVDQLFAEIKIFAFEQFAHLDKDSDGFISQPELEQALSSDGFSVKQRAFVSFLLRRIEEIRDTYKEEWAAGGRQGISLVDLQEYFASHTTR
jgi:hypothetical protein